MARVAAFLAIVWAVAASFIAFELASLSGFDVLLGNDSVRALALPSAVRDSTTCDVSQAEPGRAPTREPSGDVDAAAWLLGVKAGMNAQMARRIAASSPPGGNPGLHQSVAQTTREIEQLAAFLQVPRPVSFPAQDAVDPNSAFMMAVEADPDRTARGIALNRAEHACHLYKLGAYWGYAMMIRIALPGERSAFAVEIDHHATKAGLPRPLWQPAIDRTASDANAEDLVAESVHITDAITAHLRTGKPSEGGREEP